MQVRAFERYIPLSTQNIQYRGKGRACWFCFLCFSSGNVFECSEGTSHRDVSFEHTKQEFWWEIMNIFVNIKNMFCLFKWVSR